jgi:hypothetical protein
LEVLLDFFNVSAGALVGGAPEVAEEVGDVVSFVACGCEGLSVGLAEAAVVVVLAWQLCFDVFEVFG